MEQGMLSVGLSSVFSLKLLKKVYEKNKSYTKFIVTEQDFKFISRVVQESKGLCDQKELMQFINGAEILDETLLSQNQPEISVWCYNYTFHYIDEYGKDFLNKFSEIITLVNKNCTISELNYICNEPYDLQRKFYSSIVEEKLGRLHQNMAENLNIINEIHSKLHITTNIFSIPVSCNITVQEDNSILEFKRRYYDFKEWVTSRVPDFFTGNVLQLDCTDLYVNNITFPELIEQLIKCHKSCSPKQWNSFSLAEEHYFDMEQAVRCLQECLDINLEPVRDASGMDGVDKVFDNLLLYHMPYLIGKQRSNKPDGNRKLSLAAEVDDSLLRASQNESKNGADIVLTKKVVTSGDGQELAYYTAGAGIPIYIVNAYGVAVDVWKPLISLLAEHYYIIIGEIRGINNNERPINTQNEHYGLYDHVDDIEKVIEAEKIDALHMISWCSGAKQAILYAARDKVKILSQIIIAGEFAPYNDSEKDHSKFRKSVQEIFQIIKNDERMFEFYLKIINKSIFKNTLDFQGLTNKAQTAEVRDIVELLFEIIPQKDRSIILDAFTSKEKMRNFLTMCVEYYQHDVESVITSLNMPALLVSSDKDNVANPKQSEWAHSKFRNSVYVPFPEATHSIVKERYIDLYNLIKQHLETIG
ncbi:MAG: alpha/beta hydrolase [Clostridia bacterium]|nr:alpha/beta hydrolase [Clostridia bacterium]